MFNTKRSLMSLAVAATIAATSMAAHAANYVNAYNPVFTGETVKADPGKFETDGSIIVPPSAVGAIELYAPENLFSETPTESTKATALPVYLPISDTEVAFIPANVVINTNVEGGVLSGLAILSDFSGDITINENRTVSGEYGVRYLAEQSAYDDGFNSAGGSLINSGTITGNSAAVRIQKHDAVATAAANLTDFLNENFDGGTEGIVNYGTLSSNGYAVTSDIDSSTNITNANTGEMIGALSGNLDIQNSGSITTWRAGQFDYISSYVGEAGSTLILSATASTPSNSPILEVTGTADFKSGSSILFNPDLSVLELLQYDEDSKKSYLLAGSCK